MSIQWTKLADQFSPLLQYADADLHALEMIKFDARKGPWYQSFDSYVIPSDKTDLRFQATFPQLRFAEIGYVKHILLCGSVRGRDGHKVFGHVTVLNPRRVERSYNRSDNRFYDPADFHTTVYYKGTCKDGITIYQKQCSEHFQLDCGANKLKVIRVDKRESAHAHAHDYASDLVNRFMAYLIKINGIGPKQLEGSRKSFNMADACWRADRVKDGFAVKKIKTTCRVVK